MTIFIDGDGCPVVALTVSAAKRFGVPCVLICDTSHGFCLEGVQTITVSKGTDSVDFALVNLVRPGDCVVTQDYGLAAMCLARQAIPIRQDGLVYTDENIDPLLNQRHMAKKVRMAGGRLKGAAKRTPQQDAEFEAALHALLSGHTP